ncbi:MAG: THUMP domain-containing protein, partial [Halobacteria archaeon]|nr:THUMP domain-containing protein [Halobacteria archaeon]
LSWGLSNYERGRSLRTVIAMEDDDEYERESPGECWVCDGAFTEVDEWAERAVKQAEGYDFDTYLVGTRVPPIIEENESLLDDLFEDEYAQQFKSEFNREVGKRIGQEIGAEVGFERPDVVFLLNLEDKTVELQVNPVYIYGRYRKLERDIPQ